MKFGWIFCILWKVIYADSADWSEVGLQPVILLIVDEPINYFQKCIKNQKYLSVFATF